MRDTGGPALSEEVAYLLVGAVEQVLQGREPDAYAAFEIDGEVVTLIVRGEAHLVRLIDDYTAAEIRFLGIRRGDYIEKIDRVEGGIRVRASFRHPEGQLFEFELSSAPSSAYHSPDALARRKQLERLRTIMRAWSSLPAREPNREPRASGLSIPRLGGRGLGGNVRNGERSWIKRKNPGWSRYAAEREAAIRQRSRRSPQAAARSRLSSPDRRSTLAGR